LKMREAAVLLPLVGVIVFTGLYPKPMLDRIEPSVKRLIEHVSDKTTYVEPQTSGATP
jgi:NADH-quinone oxidoreductase subunit M